MQIFWEITGHYECLADNGKPAATSLANLLTDLRAISTDQRRYHLPAVHQSFGLNFLPVNAVTHLMQQTSGRSPLLANQTLRPFIQNRNDLASQQFQYRFVSKSLNGNFVKNLEPDDPQIPQGFGDRCEGTYQVLLENSSDPIIQKVEAEAAENLRQLVQNCPLEVLNLALHSKDPELLSIPLSDNCTAWIQPTELPQALQEASKILRDQSGNIIFPEAIQKLANAYRSKYPEPVVISDRIPSFAIANITPRADVEIGKGTHRHILEKLITNAQKFLFICSYRLEDQAIMEMIAEKSKQIPIWILTSFSNEVQNRVDSNVDGERESDPEYADSDFKKRKCLGILRKAGLGFRSGNFHIKTYISEQSAYLGSCNLTGGSLERNGEAGMLWQSTSEHQFLIEYFRYLWMHQTISQFVPSPVGFRSESLEKFSGSPPQIDRLLDHYAFQTRFIRFTQEVFWTRKFAYTHELFSLRSYNLICSLILKIASTTAIVTIQAYRLNKSLIFMPKSLSLAHELLTSALKILPLVTIHCLI